MDKNPKHITDETLVEDVKAVPDGSEASALAARYMGLICAIASKFRGNGADYDDLVSEGLLAYICAIRGYNPELGSFKAYASVCIANRMKTLLSSGISQKNAVDYNTDLTEIADKGDSPEDFVISNEQTRALHSELARLLSPLELSVLELYADSFSYSQIASFLSITAKSVDNALSRARKKLKRIYKI